jgi:hypothetical protein
MVLSRNLTWVVSSLRKLTTSKRPTALLVTIRTGRILRITMVVKTTHPGAVVVIDVGDNDAHNRLDRKSRLDPKGLRTARPSKPSLSSAPQQSGD